MKKQLILTTVALAVSLLFLSGLAMAAPKGTVNLNWGYHLNASDTACPKGKELINVTRKIINSLDSGTGSNDFGEVWWATSDYNQHIKVVETEEGFCATVTYQGKVESVGGDGPGCLNDSNCGMPEGRLEAGVTGTFQGGYTGNFTGEFNPTLPTRGNLGTFDALCDASAANGGCAFSGSFDWRNDYFDNATFPSLPWWGWVYHAGKNGSWVNTSDGNEGNITGD